MSKLSAFVVLLLMLASCIHMVSQNSQHIMLSSDCEQTQNSFPENKVADFHTVSGFIYHKSERIADAQIRLKGSDIVARSDAHGNYQINAPANGVLVVTMLGYDCKEVLVPERNTLNVELRESM